MQKVCVIIPCFNEARRLRAAEISAYLTKRPGISLLLMDDGSTDDTLAVFETVRQEHSSSVEILSLKSNSGKAEAVRQGMLHAGRTGSWDLVGFFDADFATSLTEIDAMAQLFLDRNELQFVFGSRVKLLGRDIRRNEYRHYAGRVFSTLASLLLLLPVYDTQCGVKLFKSDMTASLFAEPFHSRWLFDVEIFQRLVQLVGRDRIREIAYEFPLNSWSERGGSKIKFIHVLGMPFDLWTLWRRNGRHS